MKIKELMKTKKFKIYLIIAIVVIIFGIVCGAVGYSVGNAHAEAEIEESKKDKQKDKNQDDSEETEETEETEVVEVDTRIKMPISGSNCLGKQYTEVQDLLMDAGFTKIICHNVTVVSDADDVVNGKVEFITVNNEVGFLADTMYEPNSPIMIIYVTYVKPGEKEREYNAVDSIEMKYATENFHMEQEKASWVSGEGMRLTVVATPAGLHSDDITLDFSKDDMECSLISVTSDYVNNSTIYEYAFNSINEKRTESTISVWSNKDKEMKKDITFTMMRKDETDLVYFNPEVMIYHMNPDCEEGDFVISYLYDMRLMDILACEECATYFTVPNVQDMTLADAIATLNESGLKNISVPQQEEIKDNKKWFVTSQSVTAGKLVYGTEIIELTCLETEDYYNDLYTKLFTDLNVNDAADLAQEYGMKVTYKSNMDNSDVTKRINNMTNSRRNQIKVARMEYNIKNSKAIVLYVNYKESAQDLLEDKLPLSDAQEAFRVAMVNFVSTDNITADGQYVQSKLHGSDYSGEFAVALSSRGSWTVLDENTWHVVNEVYYMTNNDNHYRKVVSGTVSLDSKGYHVSCDMVFGAKKYIDSNDTSKLGESEDSIVLPKKLVK